MSMLCATAKKASIRKGNVEEKRGTRAQGLRVDCIVSSFRGFPADCQAGRCLRFPASTDLGMQLHKRGSRRKCPEEGSIVERGEIRCLTCPCKGQRNHCMSQTNRETTSFFRQTLGVCGKNVPMSKVAEGVVPEGMKFIQQTLCWTSLQEYWPAGWGERK